LTDMKEEFVSIQIVTWNSEGFIQPCLESILNQSYKNFRVLVLDNASTDRTQEIIQRYSSRLDYIPLRNNTGFSHGHNVGFSLAKAEYILVMNPDVILTPTYLEKIMEAIQSDPRVGAAGGKLYRWNGHQTSTSIDSMGIQFHPYKRVFSDCTLDGTKPREVFGISGACALYRRRMLEDVKLGNEYFDEDFFAYFEDVDLAWHARSLGWKAMVIPDAVAYHYRHAAQQGVFQFVRNLGFRNRYFVLIKNDSLKDIFKVLPIFILFEFLRHVKLFFTSPRLLLQWAVILKYIPRMLKKRRLIQQKQAKHAT